MISGQQDTIPDGQFVLPVCTTKENLRKMLSILHFGIYEAGYGDDEAALTDIYNALAYLEDPENSPCYDLEPGCYEMPALSSRIAYQPFDPRDPDASSYDETIWNDQPLRIVSPGLNLPGVQPGDVITTFDQLVFNNNALVTQGFPTAIVNLQPGTESVKVTFVELPQGGQAIIWFDNNLLSTDVVDLNSGGVIDWSSLNNFLDLVLDGELAEERIYERDVPPGAQQMKILFAPTVGGSDILGYGGGLRSVEECGIVTPIQELGDMLRVDPNDSCQIQQSTDGGATWTNVFRLDACQIEGPPGPEGPAGPQGPAGPEGPAGPAAPTPAISTAQLIDGTGTTVSFDMDGDGQFDDGGFTVFNGEDGPEGPQGPAGPAGVSPVITLQDTSFGVNILVDNDADGTNDQAATVFDGINGTTPPPDTGDSLCGAAYKISNEIINKVTAELARDFTQYNNVGEYLEDLLATGGVGYWVLQAADDAADYALSQLSPSERTTAISELTAFVDELAEMFYCADLDRTATSAAIDADGTLSAFTRNTLRNYYDAITDGQIAIWAVVGYRDTSQDCSAFNCAGGPGQVFDFTQGELGWRDANGAGGAVHVPGTGWQQNAQNHLVAIEYQLSQPLTLDTVKVHFSPAMDSGRDEVWIYVDGTRIYQAQHSGESIVTANIGTQTANSSIWVFGLEYNSGSGTMDSLITRVDLI